MNKQYIEHHSSSAATDYCGPARGQARCPSPPAAGPPAAVLGNPGRCRAPALSAASGKDPGLNVYNNVNIKKKFFYVIFDKNR